MPSAPGYPLQVLIPLRCIEFILSLSKEAFHFYPSRADAPRRYLHVVKKILLFALLVTSTKAFSQSLLSTSDVDTLRSYMVGSFSSQAQSQQDSSYLNVHLNINTVWPHRIDGKWLYAEYALAENLDKPYRQTVYHLFLINDTTIVCQPYELVEPSRVTGAWHNPEKFNPLRIDSLKLLVGCSMSVHKSYDGFYYGATGKECTALRSGAAYATSELKIYQDKLVSWERGWDMYDKQAWGAANDGYIFIKEK